MTSLADRIQLGVLFLDDTQPGWAGHIDMDRLDLEDPESCVLGQLFEDEADPPYEFGRTGFLMGSLAFHDWLEKNELGVTNNDNAAVLGGFERENLETSDSADEEYDELQAAWMKVITS